MSLLQHPAQEITTDHGRGTVPIDTWRGHGKDIIGSDQVWVMAFGKKIKSIGVVLLGVNPMFIFNFLSGKFSINCPVF